MKPRGEARVATVFADALHHLQEDLLGGIGRRGCVAMEVMQCDGIHAVLVRVVNRAQRVPIAR